MGAAGSICSLPQPASDLPKPNSIDRAPARRDKGAESANVSTPVPAPPSESAWTRLQYRLLKQIAPGEPTHMSGVAYANRSKLQVLLGAALLEEVRGLDVLDFGCGVGAEATYAEATQAGRSPCPFRHPSQCVGTGLLAD